MKLLVGALFALVVSAHPGGDGIRRRDEHPFVHDPFAHPDDYTSGKVHRLAMDAMTAAVDAILSDVKHATGIFDPAVGMDSIKEYTPCIDGYAGKDVNNTYMCRNLDLYSFTPHRDLGSPRMQLGNDIWGWSATRTSDGVTREFGLIGQFDGTAFVEVLPTGQIAYLGRLPPQSGTAIWRDIKVIGEHAYIGSEAFGHGIQVFDLKSVRFKALVGTWPLSIIRDLAPRPFLAQEPQRIQHRHGPDGLVLRRSSSRIVSQPRLSCREKSHHCCWRKATLRVRSQPCFSSCN